MGTKLNYTLKELKAVVKKHLLLDDYMVVEIIMAVIVANFFPTDPLWLLIIGPSSSAKTELLASLEGLPFTFFLSDLTTNTLISGKQDASLLPKLKNKIIVMKDFTTILSKRPDDLKIIMGHLREVYDGKLTKSYGTGDTVKWSGHIGFLGACTPVYDRKHGVISQMGERFLLYRNRNDRDFEAGAHALASFGTETKMRTELKSVFKRFIIQFKKADLIVPKLEHELQEKIVSLATICGHGRCHVHRDPYSKDEITYLPEPEGSPRLAKQLYHLGIALMAVNGVDQFTENIYAALKKVGRDLIPSIRFRCLQYLRDNRSFQVGGLLRSTADISTGTGLNGKTVLRTMQDLSVIGVTAYELGTAAQGTPYLWGLTTKAKTLIEMSGIFD